MVSILILVQDRFNFFERCIKSIIENTNTDFEFVFVLQGVKDERILKIIELLPYKKKVIKNEVNNGVTPGRNQAILAASGDYLLFFDDDAFVDNNEAFLSEEDRKKDWLQRMLQYFEKDEKVGVVSQSGSYINPETKGVFWNCIVRGAEVDVGQGYCFMFSRKVVDTIGILDPYYGNFWHEESDYALSAKLHGFKVINAGYIGVYHVGSSSGDDGSYGRKIDYLFKKWQPYFDKILVKKDLWNKEVKENESV